MALELDSDLNLVVLVQTLFANSQIKLLGKIIELSSENHVQIPLPLILAQKQLLLPFDCFASGT